MKKDILLGDEFISATQFITSHIINIGDDVYHHHSFFEIFYIIDGEIEHECNNIKTLLKAGDMFILRPCDSHIFLRNKNNLSYHRDIIINNDLFQDCCNFLSSTLFNEILASPDPLKISLSIEQIKKFENTITSYNNFPIFDNYKIKAAFSKTIVSDLLFLYMESKYQQNNFPSWINVIISRFNTPYYIQMGLNTILEDINYNKSYICKTFKKLFNKNMTQYLLDIRLNYAANLISSSNDNLETIIEKIGINSLPFFIKKFKEKFNYTPHTYRKITTKK